MEADKTKNRTLSSILFLTPPLHKKNNCDELLGLGVSIKRKKKRQFNIYVYRIVGVKNYLCI